MLDGFCARRVNRGLEVADRLQPRGCAHDENAAVPPVALRRDVLFRELEVGLLDETVEAPRAVGFVGGERLADVNVSVADFRARRHDAHRHDLPCRRVPHANGHGGLECIEVRERMIRGHHHEYAVLLFGRHRKRGDGERGCSVASCGLEDQACALAFAPDLLGGREAMFLVAHDQQLIGERNAFGERVEDFFLLSDRHNAPLGAALRDRLLHALLERIGPSKD